VNRFIQANKARFLTQTKIKKKILEAAEILGSDEFLLRKEFK